MFMETAGLTEANEDQTEVVELKRERDAIRQNKSFVPYCFGRNISMNTKRIIKLHNRKILFITICSDARVRKKHITHSLRIKI